MSDDPLVKVTVFLPASLQLAVTQLARARRTNVSALCRAALRNEPERTAREAASSPPAQDATGAMPQ